MEDDFYDVDPSDFAKYASIEDILSDQTYQDKKVRILGTVVQNDKQAKKIVVAHNNSKIECSIPEEYIDKIEESQTYQIVGIVKPVFPNVFIEALIVKSLSSVDQSAYDFAIQKFNNFVFQ